MLKVNVGLSRKLSKDYNSQGFTLNLEGEVSAALDDPEAVIERIKEFYDLAEEALDLQVQRTQGDYEMADRDAEAKASTINGSNGRSLQGVTGSHEAPYSHANGHGNGAGQPHQNGNGHSPSEPASNKQIQFLLNLGKRQRLTAAQLERKASEIFGRQVGLYELNKREAARLIDELNVEPAPARRFARA